MKYFFKKSQKMIVYVLVAAMMLSGLMQYNLVNAEAATKTLRKTWASKADIKVAEGETFYQGASSGSLKEYNKNIPKVDGVEYATALKVSKGSNVTFNVPNKGTLSMYVVSTNTKEASLELQGPDGSSKVIAAAGTLTKDTPVLVTTELDAAGSYVIVNGGKEVHLLYVEFTYDDATSGGDTSEESTEESTEAPTEESTEAPTEPSTEAPTEESTEASTEAPTEAPSEESSEPSGEVASEYNHNFTDDGFTSNFYTISGSEKTGISATVNGKTYTQGLKLNSDGKVTFKSTKEGTLTLVLSNGKSGKAISVDGTEYAVEEATVVITVDKLPAGDHTIERANGETYLLFIGLSYASDTTAAPAVKHRVELDGNIGVTFAFKDAAAGSKVTFTCDGKDSVDVAYDASNVVTIDGTAYTMFSYNVYATEMNKAIKATLYDANGEVIKEDTCSVAQYCKEMLGKESTDEATKAAINALLVYGAEADAYFEKDATWLKDVTDATLVSLTEAEINKLQSYPAQRVDQSGYEASDITASAASLYFDTQTAIRFYFSKKDGTPFTEAEAATLTETYLFTDGVGTIYKTTGYNKNGFYVEIPNIGPKNLDKSYHVIVYNTDNVPVQMVLYSAFTFVHNKLDNPKHTNLVTAIYRYNEALENYGTN